MDTVLAVMPVWSLKADGGMVDRVVDAAAMPVVDAPRTSEAATTTETGTTAHRVRWRVVAPWSVVVVMRSVLPCLSTTGRSWTCPPGGVVARDSRDWRALTCGRPGQRASPGGPSGPGPGASRRCMAWILARSRVANSPRPPR